MKHNYLDNIPLEEAKEKFFTLAKKDFTHKTEEISTTEAVGRVLSGAVYAKICCPHYNASAMDGIAVKAKDTYSASESTPVILTADMYTVVDTGDAIPDDKDAVIMVEDLSFENNGRVKIIASVHPFQNVRQIGEDICMGDMIAPSFTVVTPSLCGAMLAGGIIKATVIEKPVVAIIPTGDEIVSPTDNPKRGEIIEFNSSIFSGMLKSWDADTVVYPIIPDKKDMIKLSVKEAAEKYDAVLVLAGSSAGRDDYTCDIIKELGEVCVHGIAIKPGKPAVLGKIGSTPVVGLPGYPVSAIVVMREIVRDLIAFLSHKTVKAENKITAVLGKRIIFSLKYREYVRVTIGKIGEIYVAVPLPRGAGIVTSFTKADGIIVVPQNSEGIEQGEAVDVILVNPCKDIENSIIMTGSHDPIIDEINDLLKIKGYPYSVSSSHVGSMGALSAVKLGQAHLGGIHLLDTETGRYNDSYVEKYLDADTATHVKGIGRIQGLMVEKGNPKNIKGFADIVDHRYVNRQLGSGTRILFDYLLKTNGIDKNEIDGYRNEEFTHTAVAAQIAGGNADCGLGIYSAAQMYGLDFIELSVEEYDFIVNNDFINTPMYNAFMEVFRSDELKERMKEMGGYTLG
ncbi:MAG: molybdopterin biosynthesis protein [Clostridia bacterium]|nr:molybdopterin biosynthesis protein [Clostridia bacterium]